MTEILDTPASTQLREHLFPDRAISSAHIAEIIKNAHPFKREEALTPQEPRVPLVPTQAKAAHKLKDTILTPGS